MPGPSKPAIPASIGRLKHGARLERFVLGDLPPKLSRVKRWAQEFRRRLESEVISTHGEIDFQHAAFIDSAAASELAASVARWCLLHKFDGMSTSDVLNCCNALTGHKRSRDKAIAQLDLRASKAGALAANYSTHLEFDNESTDSDVPEWLVTAQDEVATIEPSDSAHAHDSSNTTARTDPHG